mmetsp:Transcript_46069/g.147345  ORF Transcript_46069/g.147345 Transcript_46069/m.147345 type:complete len:154 (-) Transcript_46069:563-1024(-)
MSFAPAMMTLPSRATGLASVSRNGAPPKVASALRATARPARDRHAQRLVTQAHRDFDDISMLESADFEDDEKVVAWMDQTLMDLKIKSAKLIRDECKGSLEKHFSKDPAPASVTAAAAAAIADMSDYARSIVCLEVCSQHSAPLFPHSTSSPN